MSIVGGQSCGRLVISHAPSLPLSSRCHPSGCHHPHYILPVHPPSSLSSPLLITHPFDGTSDGPESDGEVGAQGDRCRAAKRLDRTGCADRKGGGEHRQAGWAEGGGGGRERDGKPQSRQGMSREGRSACAAACGLRLDVEGRRREEGDGGTMHGVRVGESMPYRYSG